MTPLPPEYRTKIDWLTDAIEKHNSDECLMWPFSIDRDGYGRVCFYENGKKLRVGAHRASLRIILGRWPEPMALHACDVPGCFNPQHLFEGTDEDNHKDQVAKGRQTRGEKQSQSKLTDETVLSARKEYEGTDMGVHRLAKKYGVTKQAMKNALRGIKNWKHVPNPVRINKKKRNLLTHCGKGHHLTPENIYVYKDGKCRQCKACTVLRSKKRLKGIK